jgi:hypothetical protein
MGSRIRVGRALGMAACPATQFSAEILKEIKSLNLAKINEAHQLELMQMKKISKLNLN